MRPEPLTKRVNRRPVVGSETILVVEDDDSVRTLIRSVLKRAGYEVLEARNGGEALVLCESHVSAIDLVLTDVVMPQMSGRELANRLTATRPEIRLLFMSGYTDAAIVEQGTIDPRTPFLQKPFTPVVLGRKVRQILDLEPGNLPSTAE
jgi:two-component system cell cycle sensor histidine kinase/response regulator CckA